MTEHATTERRSASANGIAPATRANDKPSPAAHEALVRAAYERCHPDESFDDLKRRARFSKHDRGLLRDWMSVSAATAKRLAQSPMRGAPDRLAA